MRRLSRFFSRPPAAPIEGGLYATPGDEGGYTVVKLLKVDAHGVHARLYSNRFDTLPETIDESALYLAGMDREPGEALGMGHLPLSRKTFAGWGAVFVQPATVDETELDGYRMWEEARGGYF